MDDNLVAIILFIVLFGGLFGFLTVKSYLKYRRDMAMIEQGMYPNGTTPGSSRMERALTLTGIGLALTIGLLFTGLGPQLLGGLIPLFIGLSRLLAILLEQEQAKSLVVRENEESTK